MIKNIHNKQMSIYTLYKDVYKLLYMIISFWIHFKFFKDEEYILKTS
jgi:hypothetical protein